MARERVVEYVTIEVLIEQRTTGAILVSLADDDDFEPVWVPLSLTHGADNCKVNDVLEIEIAEWKAGELGLV